MAKGIKLTDRSIRSLPVPGRETAQVDYWDASLPGFGVRVSYGGRRAFVAMYRVNGVRRRLTIGPYPLMPLGDARERAKQAMRAALAGEDPTAARRARRQAMTVAELADLYIEDYAKPRKRSWKEDQSIITNYVKPALGKLKVMDVTRGQIRDMLRPLAERTAVRANRTAEVVRRMFSWAISEDKIVLQANPAAGIGKLNGEETRRERVLKKDEIRALWAALEAEPAWARGCLRVMLLTGQREGEVLGMGTRELDGTWWTIPGERAKNGQTHRVPFTPFVSQIIAELTKGREGLVFGRKRTALATIWKAACERAGIEDARMHDLRRTAATTMGSLGVGRLVVSKLLNHADSKVTAIYERHGYDQEKLDALTRLEAHVLTMVGQVPVVLPPLRHADA
jgi:integrase